MEEWMLDISPVLLLLSSGFIFLLVVARLNSCLFKPLIKHMDDRAASIKKRFRRRKIKRCWRWWFISASKWFIVGAKKRLLQLENKLIREAKDSADAKLASAKSNLEARSVGIC